MSICKQLGEHDESTVFGFHLIQGNMSSLISTDSVLVSQIFIFPRCDMFPVVFEAFTSR